ncbi:hypothetical protein [Frigoriflavimonas asaccharolytica]|uniref:Uncharacterized protein n=1 Tax=Frigoriflavimonas asaccharolytica TaxID=2735899 RepID=A0A8J8G5H0_9FLAO|nr:hypothetical protein [Frigoriflavimonas asaccharolytica]NRS91614.1 hypothetical protein [Frigoriflavimonas asaccharolytica]
MKKLLLLSCSLLFLANCGKKEDKVEEDSTSISDVFNGAKNLNNLSNSLEDIQKETEELKKLAPISNDALKAVMPETVMGMKRTSISVGDNSMIQMSSAEAEYTGEENKKVKITVMDGAGETGSAMISMMKMGLATNSEKTTDTSFEKMGEFNGVKASIKERNKDTFVDSEIQYILKSRFLVTIEGNGYTTDELKVVMDTINSSDLK